MGTTKGVEITKEVIGKLSKGKLVSSQLSEAFNIALTGCDTDFSNIHFGQLHILRNEYDNQIKNEISTVGNSGELNTAYKSLFQLHHRLRSLADRVIEAKEEDDE
ncbi:MAG: hypothetical protein WKG06_09270 [Segetibacter sp.]